MVKPYVISGKTKVTLSRWPEYTNDEHVLLKSDDLLTACEPTDEIIAAYAKKVGKKVEDFEVKEEEEPVLLNEEDQGVPEGDEYEPRYSEEPDNSW